MWDKSPQSSSSPTPGIPSFDPLQLAKANKNHLFSVQEEDKFGSIPWSLQPQNKNENKPAGYVPSRFIRSHSTTNNENVNHIMVQMYDKRRMSVDARHLGQRWSETAFDRANIELRHADKRVITDFGKLRGIKDTIKESSDEFQ